jgi:acetolactate synthase regulatory subunit
MKTFHICWISGTTEAGAPMSTGITVEGESILEALATFLYDHKDIEPIYITQMNF